MIALNWKLCLVPIRSQLADTLTEGHPLRHFTEPKILKKLRIHLRSPVDALDILRRHQFARPLVTFRIQVSFILFGEVANIQVALSISVYLFISLCLHNITSTYLFFRFEIFYKFLLDELLRTWYSLNLCLIIGFSVFIARSQSKVSMYHFQTR